MRTGRLNHITTFLSVIHGFTSHIIPTFRAALITNKNGVKVTMMCDQTGAEHDDSAVMKLGGDRKTAPTVFFTIANTSRQRVRLISAVHFYMYDKSSVSLSDPSDVSTTQNTHVIQGSGKRKLCVIYKIYHCFIDHLLFYTYM